MKKIQNIAIASILTLVISATAFAGDISYGKPGDISYGKPGDISYGKLGDISYGKPGDISYGKESILVYLISVAAGLIR